jgi:hypothetical protein
MMKEAFDFVGLLLGLNKGVDLVKNPDTSV